MTRRWLVLICCAFLSTASLLAQSRSAASDPISGTWTGELHLGRASGPSAISLDLKFDGKSAVAGTLSGLPNPGDVKTGTFDLKTGALNLNLGIVGQDAVLIVLDGIVEKGTASGRVSGEAGTGEFELKKKE